VNEKNSNDKTAFSTANMESDTCNEPVAKRQAAPHDTRCSIHLHSRRKRLTDADGVSGKAAIDGLVHAGLLADDSPEYVQEVSYSQAKIKKGEAEETLIEIWVNDDDL